MGTSSSTQKEFIPDLVPPIDRPEDTVVANGGLVPGDDPWKPPIQPRGPENGLLNLAQATHQVPPGPAPTWINTSVTDGFASGHCTRQALPLATLLPTVPSLRNTPGHHGPSLASQSVTASRFAGGGSLSQASAPSRAVISQLEMKQRLMEECLPFGHKPACVQAKHIPVPTVSRPRCKPPHWDSIDDVGPYKVFMFGAPNPTSPTSPTRSGRNMHEEPTGDIDRCGSGPRTLEGDYEIQYDDEFQEDHESEEDYEDMDDFEDMDDSMLRFIAAATAHTATPVKYPRKQSVERRMHHSEIPAAAAKITAPNTGDHSYACADSAGDSSKEDASSSDGEDYNPAYAQSVKLRSEAYPLNNRSNTSTPLRGPCQPATRAITSESEQAAQPIGTGGFTSGSRNFTTTPQSRCECLSKATSLGSTPTGTAHQLVGNTTHNVMKHQHPAGPNEATLPPNPPEWRPRRTVPTPLSNQRPTPFLCGKKLVLRKPSITKRKTHELVIPSPTLSPNGRRTFLCATMTESNGYGCESDCTWM